MKKFDPTKPVQTRDGRKARIIAFDVKNRDYPIAALVEFNKGEELPSIYTIDGFFHVGSSGNYHGDLVNVPEKHKRWINIYATDPGYTSREEANRHAAGRWRKALICIEFEEGEGLV